MNKSKSLYSQIASSIKQDITSGVYSSNLKLPSENKLSSKYNVSRITIRKALEQLINEDIIYTKKGSGTYIVQDEKLLIFKRSTHIFSFNNEMNDLNKKASTNVEMFEIMTVNEKLASLLNLKINERVYHFKRTRFADNKPIVSEETYMPVSGFEDLTLLDLEKSKYYYVEKIKNRQIAFSHHSISIILADDYLSDKLRLPKDTPLLHIKNTTYLDDGALLDITFISVDPSTYEVEYIKHCNHQDI